MKELSRARIISEKRSEHVRWMDVHEIVWREDSVFFFIYSLKYKMCVTEECTILIFHFLAKCKEAEDEFFVDTSSAEIKDEMKSSAISKASVQEAGFGAYK